MTDRSPVTSVPGATRWLLAVAAVATLAAAAGIPARATYGARTTADEPQYLMSADSLGHDGDLDISDEIATRAYRPYHEITINQQTLPPGEDDQIRLSPHDPLLPLVLAAPMRLGGWAAAKAALALIAGLTAALTLWLATARFGVRPLVGTIVVAAAFSGIPLAAYGSQVYPEMPAALAALAAFAAITGDVARRRVVVVALVAVVALPWLSVKYLPVAAVLGVGLVVARARRGLPLAGVITSAAVAGATYLLVHRAWYGGWTVYAAGDHFVDSGELAVVGTAVDPLGRTRRLVGLLVDRHFGIAAWTPLWLAAPAALAALARRRPSGTGWMLLLAAVAAGWANASFVALTMHGWWVPGRQIVVVLPLVVVAMAWAAEQAASRWPVRRVIAVAAAVAALGASTWLWLATEASTDRRTLVVDFGSSAHPLRLAWRSLLPDGQRAGPLDDQLLLAWAALIVASAVVAWHRRARGRVRSGAAVRAPSVAEAGSPSARPAR